MQAHDYIAAFALSFLFALYWTPVMRRAAERMGIVDRPDGGLKTHAAAVPYLGGLAVFIAFLTTVGLLTRFEQETLGLLLSGTIVLVVGLIDDFGVLTAWQKLLGQTLAALTLINSGIYVRLEFLSWPLAIALTVLWLLSVTNAFNIIDIMDGLASGIAVVAGLAVGLADLLAGREGPALLSLALAGAAMGFLRHNFHPARIYLGDAGSLFVGFMLAALSMNAGYTRVNVIAALSPVLILGIPLFDLALVVYIRWRSGRPITQGSPDHYALRLRRCRLSVRATTCISYAAAALLGAAALLMSLAPAELAAATAAAALSAAVVSAWFLIKVDAGP